MDKEELMQGYQSILKQIYSIKSYHERLKVFLQRFQPGKVNRARVNKENILALLRSVLYIGILDRSRMQYWKLLTWSLFRKPAIFPLAVTYSIYGYHFRKVYRIDD